MQQIRNVGRRQLLGLRRGDDTTKASNNRLRFIAGLAALGLAASLAGVGPATAVHDDGFELDGNIVVNADEDWENTFEGPGTAFAGNDVGAEDDVFALGSSKDYLDVSGWHHKFGNVPDKDQITNAYATAVASGSDTLIYFGMDRFATEGSANLGFWFLQDDAFGKVDGGDFTGTHVARTVDPDTDEILTRGDILVLSEFDEGGENASIKVFEWVGSGGDEGGGSLQTIDTGLGVGEADCDLLTGSVEASACANVNTAVIYDDDIPWDYQGKKVRGKPVSDMPTASFFEGGINLTELFGETPCISNFVAETRSSFETNAILKDLATDAFELCGSLKWLKVDGDGNPLGGATFRVCALHEADDETDDVCWTVEDNVVPDPPEAGKAADEDDADGVFLLGDLQPGQYSIEETEAPEGYALDESVKEVTVVQSDIPAQPMVDEDGEGGEDPVEDPFVNLGVFKIIVLTCNTATGELVDSTVDLDDGDETTDNRTATLVDEDLNDLCDTGGAVYDDLEAGDYALDVELPDEGGTFPE